MESAEKHLILGGERSGKSDHALDLLNAVQGPTALIATAQVLDPDFRKRVMKHKKERRPEIPVYEVTVELPQMLASIAPHYSAVLVEGLDYWLYACSCAGNVEDHVSNLLQTLQTIQTTKIFLVSCETGLGPVAATTEARAFVRAIGHLNRALASLCSTVELVIAGRVLQLPE